MKVTKNNNLPLVSVIIPIYNTENYLLECLESLANQNYGLENIETILIDDRGNDNSYEIAKNHLPKLGPHSKLIRHKTNKGLGAARNTGIKASKGKFILFVDSDDYITPDTIGGLVDIVMEHESDIAIYNMHSFSNDLSSHPLNPSFDIFKALDEPKKISRFELPQYPDLAHSFSACNKLFKRELFSNKRDFPEKQHHEDALLIMTLLCESKSISLVGNIFYQYRQRDLDADKSITDTLFQNKNHFTEHLAIAKGLIQLGETYPELEYMMLWASLRILGTPANRILNSTSPLSNSEELSFFKHLQNLLKEKDIKRTYKIGEKISKDTIFNINILMRANNLKAARDHFNKIAFKRKIINILSTAKKITIKSLKTSISYIKTATSAPSALTTSLLKHQSKTDKDLILISERPNEARDNGYYFFEYLRKNHPHINIHYVIKEGSPDFEKVKKLGNFIIYDSLEHEQYFFSCNTIICTHTRGTIEPSFFNKNTVKREYPDYYKKNYIFLQHGINVGGFINSFSKKNTLNANFTKIVSGAEPEFNYLDQNLGYEEGVVTYTGLARFDSILKKEAQWGQKNRIIYMPTWRLDICSPSYLKQKKYNDFRFTQSDYYKKILSLINNPVLQQLLEKYNCDFHFIPHPEVTQYNKYFTSSLANVKIIAVENINLQEELIDSKLLITDYSSVFFDFAYMKKPVIFYQHDKDAFFSQHYQKGFFDFEDHYFGDVITEENDMISKIENTMAKGFPFPEKAMKTHNIFFKKYDVNNCERIYEELTEVLSK